MRIETVDLVGVCAQQTRVPAEVCEQAADGLAVERLPWGAGAVAGASMVLAAKQRPRGPGADGRALWAEPTRD
jgi:hypothetical protein